jgi:hypothetical protein
MVIELRGQKVSQETTPPCGRRGENRPLLHCSIQEEEERLRNVLILLLLLLTENRVHNMFRCCKLDYQAITENWAILL